MRTASIALLPVLLGACAASAGFPGPGLGGATAMPVEIDAGDGVALAFGPYQVRSFDRGWSLAASVIDGVRPSRAALYRFRLVGGVVEVRAECALQPAGSLFCALQPADRPERWSLELTRDVHGTIAGGRLQGGAATLAIEPGPGGSLYLKDGDRPMAALGQGSLWVRQDAESAQRTASAGAAAAILLLPEVGS